MLSNANQSFDFSMAVPLNAQNDLIVAIWSWQFVKVSDSISLYQDTIAPTQYPQYHSDTTDEQRRHIGSGLRENACFSPSIRSIRGHRETQRDYKFPFSQLNGSTPQTGERRDQFGLANVQLSNVHAFTATMIIHVKMMRES